MPKLGNYIKTLRLEKGMTQAELAQHLHVTDKAVSKWERDLSYPDISLYPKLADIFSVPVSKLLIRAARGLDDDTEWQNNMRQLSLDICFPIHIILGSADLVEKYADDPDKRNHYIDVIRYSCKYMLDKYEYLEKNDFRYDNREVNREILSDFIRSAAEMEAEFAENGIDDS